MAVHVVAVVPLIWVLASDSIPVAVWVMAPPMMMLTVVSVLSIVLSLFVSALFVTLLVYPGLMTRCQSVAKLHADHQHQLPHTSDA